MTDDLQTVREAAEEAIRVGTVETQALARLVLAEIERHEEGLRDRSFRSHSFERNITQAAKEIRGGATADKT